ncbi:MAG: DUF948 domain-containing protein [Syntrophorhabdales bacterium]|jgi:uncharacterized protein YoxC
MTANEVFLGVITVAAVALVIFLAWLILKLGEMIRAARQFLEETDRTMKQTTGEVNESLRSLRVITDNVGAVTNDVKTLTGSIREVTQGVQQLTGSVKDIGKAVQDLGAETVASVYGLRAGVKTGFEVFMKNLLGSKQE